MVDNKENYIKDLVSKWVDRFSGKYAILKNSNYQILDFVSRGEGMEKVSNCHLIDCRVSLPNCLLFT